MQTSKEYLLFSILSYYNLTDEVKGQFLINSLEGIDFGRSISTNANLFRDDAYGRCTEYFMNELESWKIYDIDNRTGSGGNGKSSLVFLQLYSIKGTNM